MNYEHLKSLHSARSKIQFLIQNINDEYEIKKLENISKLIEVLLLSSNPDPKRKTNSGVILSWISNTMSKM